MKASELKPVNKESINKFQPKKAEANENELSRALQAQLTRLKVKSKEEIE